MLLLSVPGLIPGSSGYLGSSLTFQWPQRLKILKTFLYIQCESALVVFPISLYPRCEILETLTQLETSHESGDRIR